MSRYTFDEHEPYVVIERESSPGIMPFLIGAALGAGVALLLAPRSGAATRRDIKRRANRVRRAAETAVSDVTTNVTGQRSTTRAVASRTRSTRRVRRSISSGSRRIGPWTRDRAAARDARRSELENRIAETKAAYNASARRWDAPRS